MNVTKPVLTFGEIACRWAEESSRTRETILADLLSAFWRGEFPSALWATRAAMEALAPDLYPSALGGKDVWIGDRRRGNPPLIETIRIADEPLNEFDPVNRVQMFEILHANERVARLMPCEFAQVCRSLEVAPLDGMREQDLLVLSNLALKHGDFRSWCGAVGETAAFWPEPPQPAPPWLDSSKPCEERISAWLKSQLSSGVKHPNKDSWRNACEIALAANEGELPEGWGVRVFSRAWEDTMPDSFKRRGSKPGSRVKSKRDQNTPGQIPG
jgi:hypothetical protein